MFLPTVFLISVVLSVLSALFLLHPRVPMHFVRFHIIICSFAPLVALFSFIRFEGNVMLGPWHFDTLSWLMALFVLTVGLVVQRYSVRYLMGDHAYRRYFALLTLTTSAASIAWLSDDLRWLIVCYGAALIGMTLLIGLNRDWKVTRETAALTGRLFAVSWLALLLAIIWLHYATGDWQLSLILSEDRLVQLGVWERTGVNLLLVLAVIIPAAQWPFQRWLLESVVAPTPVSAVMHAGLVNAGGIILTQFSPLFHGAVAQIVLLVVASISVLIGTGVSLVQVDYKRQLVGSTIAQMGFMLIQCALGAYLAAIIHLILHGLFKATLFLQSGSALRRYEGSTAKEQPSFLWSMSGRALGLGIGVSFWLMSPGEGYQFISALILGWSLAFSWTQLVALGKGRIGRIVGISLLGGLAAIYYIIHSAFHGWLHTEVHHSVHLPFSVVFIVVFILLCGSAIGMWVTRDRSSVSYAIVYLWLVRLSEAHYKSVESHPNYLKQYLSRRR